RGPRLRKVPVQGEVGAQRDEAPVGRVVVREVSLTAAPRGDYDPGVLRRRCAASAAEPLHIAGADAGEAQGRPRKTRIPCAIVLAIACSGAAGASEPYGEKPLDANTAQTFQATAANVRRDMQPGGRYAFVNAAEREKIAAALGDMDRIYAEGRMDQDTK